MSEATRKEKIKRRKRKKMIKMAIIGVIVLLAVLVGIGVVTLLFNIANDKTGKYSTDTLVIHENGKITLYEVAPFNEEMYSKSELKKFISSSIKDFNKENDTNVDLVSVKIDDANVYVTTDFRSAADYRTYSSYDTYLGTVEFMKQKLDFLDPLCIVDASQKGDIVSRDEVLSTDNAGNVVLAIKENIAVVTSGDICYVSSRNTKVVNNRTVVIYPEDGNEDAAAMVYIIYRR